MDRTYCKAPPGQYRVIGVDTFDGTDWISGDFRTLDAAMTHVVQETQGKEMLKMHVHNDQGQHCGEGGIF